MGKDPALSEMEKIYENEAVKRYQEIYNNMLGHQAQVTPLEQKDENMAEQNEPETFLGKLDTMVNRVQIFQDRFASKKPKYLLLKRGQNLAGVKNEEQKGKMHFNSPGDFENLLSNDYKNLSFQRKNNNDSKRSKQSISMRDGNQLKLRSLRNSGRSSSIIS